MDNDFEENAETPGKLPQYRLDEFKEDIKNTPEGMKTGFKSLDKIITIPNEALTIIAGRPSHGKTTFMLNMILNMVDQYRNLRFLFFSYEETRQQIGLKVVTILSEEVLNNQQNLYFIAQYIKQENVGNGDINKAILTMGDYFDQLRFNIVAEPFKIAGLREALVIEKDEPGPPIGAIFIDYIQKVKIKEAANTRQLELQKISEQLLEITKDLSVPIILGCQLGRGTGVDDKPRLDNMRESGDIEQDANVVLGLYNEAMVKHEKSKEDGENSILESEVDLEISILKNRNGQVGDRIPFRFNTPILKITEKGEA